MDISTNDEFESNNTEEQIANMLMSKFTSESQADENKLLTRVSEQGTVKTSDELINGVNDKVLLDVLSPEVKKNEKVKRKQKWCLLVGLGLFLIFQFGAVYMFTDSIINYSIKPEANVNNVKLLLRFNTGYIASVVVELIAILKYIVKSVFDTSITELIKIFKDVSEKEPEE